MKGIDYMPMLQDMAAAIDAHFSLTQDKTALIIGLCLCIIVCLAWALARLGGIKGKIDTQDAKMDIDRKAFDRMNDAIGQQNRYLDRIVHLLEKR